MYEYDVSIELMNNKPISIVLTKNNISTVIRAAFDQQEHELLLDTTLYEDAIAAAGIIWLRDNLESVRKQLEGIELWPNGYSVRLLHTY